MKKIKRVIALLCMAVTCMAFWPVAFASAAQTASVSINSPSGSVGDTISVTVTISASDDIGAATIYVSYNNSVIKPTGSTANSGVATFSFLSGDAYGKQESMSVEFEIIAAGSSSLSVTGSSRVVSIEGEVLNITSTTSGTATGNAPVSYSSDNTLSSLEISPGSLSPAFSSGVTTYYANVEKDVTELVISATATDSKAKISISGKNLDPGNNTTTITVTAEDGSTKSYVIYTTRAQDATEATTEGQTATEAQTQATTSLNIGDKLYNVVSDLSAHSLPEGYEAIDYTYDGKTVKAGKGTKTGLILMYLESIDGSGKSGFYVYDEGSKSFYEYETVAQPDITYVIMPITDSMETPDGYTLMEYNMGGATAEVMVNDDRTYCMFYGTSSLGTTGWFRYCAADGTIQQCEDLSDSVTYAAASQTETSVSVSSLNRYRKLFYGAVVVIAALIVVLISTVSVLGTSLSRNRRAFQVAMSELDDEPDMSAQDFAYAIGEAESEADGDIPDDYEEDEAEKIEILDINDDTDK